MRVFKPGLAVLALLLVLPFALVACGGDDDDDGSNDEDATRSRTTTTTRTPQPTQATPDDEDEDEDEDEDPTATRTATAVPTQGGSDPPIKDVVKDVDSKTYLVTYASSGTVDGEATTGTWVIGHKPGKYYGRIEQKDGGDTGVVVFIDDGTDVYSCFGDGTDGLCLKGVSDSGALDTAEVYDDIENDADLKEIDGRTIAGRAARCFESTVDGEEGIVCVDRQDGFLLSMESTDFSLVATDVQTSFSDELFEPPYDEI